jgi:drug/metabolite transporter (DMT)-like permease
MSPFKRREKPERTSSDRAFWYMVISSLLFVPYAPLSDSIPLGGYAAAFWRSLIVLAAFFVYALFHDDEFKPLRWRDTWGYLGFIVTVMGTWGPLAWAFKKDGIAVGTTVYAAAGLLFGIIVSIVGKTFTRTVRKKRGALSAVWLFSLLGVTMIGLIGVYLVYAPSFAHLGVKVACAAAGAGIGDTLHSLVNQHMKYYPAVQGVILVQAGSTLGNLIMVPCTHEHFTGPLSHMQVLYLGAFAACSFFGSLMNFKGTQELNDAARMVLIGLIEITGGVFLGDVLLHESITFSMWIGVACLFFASIAMEFVPSGKKTAKSSNNEPAEGAVILTAAETPASS